jgi:hypothetical protein
MKNPHLSRVALFAVLLLAGCATTQSTDPTAAAASKPDKPKVHTTAHFLTYAQLRSRAEGNPDLNKRLLIVAPGMAYRPGVSQPNVIPLIADAAGLVAKEIVNWIGTAIEAEAKKHTAQFAATLRDPNWWVRGEPNYAAVELTRTKGDDPAGEKIFDAIVLIRPVMYSTPPNSIPASYQLVPVYLLETTAAAEDFSEKMGAVISIHLESTWITPEGDPAEAVLVDYPLTVKEYELKQPYYFATKDGKDADKPTDASPYFPMPAHPATLTTTFCFVETDPSKWVGLLEKLGEAIGAEASSAGSAVQTKLAPSS